MNKIFHILLALFIGFVVGYYIKYRLVEHEGWETFESEKWISYEQGLAEYGEEYRKRMVNDFIYNQLNFKENPTKYSEVVEMIGKSEKLYDGKPLGEFMMIEEIEEKYGYIDPNGGTQLYLYFDEDSLLLHWRLEEFWYQE